jgi:cytochrome c biogenesis protein CcmG/thiol:disulfide interchange protein DsbE
MAADPAVTLRRLSVAATLVAASLGVAAWVVLTSPTEEPPDPVGRFSLEPSDNPLVASPPEPGSEAPTAPFSTLDGATSSIADYRGRPLVVNFFASWCVPCIVEMPAIEEVHQRHAADVAFLGLAVRDRPQDAAEIVRRTGVTYDIGLDPAVEMHAAFGAIAMPATAFVSPNGEILHVHNGSLDAERLDHLVREHLLL